MSQNAMLVKRRASCHVVNAFLTRFKLIWAISTEPENLQIVQEMRFWPKNPGGKGLKMPNNCRGQPYVKCHLTELIVI